MNGRALLTKDELKRFRACGVGLFLIAAILAYGGGRVCDPGRGVEWPAPCGALAALRAMVDPPKPIITQLGFFYGGMGSGFDAASNFDWTECELSVSKDEAGESEPDVVTLQDVK